MNFNIWLTSRNLNYFISKFNYYFSDSPHVYVHRQLSSIIPLLIPSVIYSSYPLIHCDIFNSLLFLDVNIINPGLKNIVKRGGSSLSFISVTFYIFVILPNDG